MSLPVNNSLQEEAKDLLPHQFYDKEGVNSLLSAATESLQGSSDTVFSILDNINLDDATGYLLDCVGSYYAVSRSGETDEEYRPRIYRKLLGSVSEGTPNELLENLSSVTKGSTRVWEHYPVSCIFETDGKTIPTTLAKDMQSASPTSSGKVVICINPDNNTHRPSELGFDTVRLVNEDLAHYTTNDPNERIVVNNLTFGGVDEEDARLSEYTYEQGVEPEPALWDNLGILCEIVYVDGGVTFYDYDFAQIDSQVNAWHTLMNFEIPTELI